MQISLDSGRQIELVKLTQWKTYYGLLAGLPHKRMNDRIVAEALDKARAHGPEGCVPVLIAPVIEVTGRAFKPLGMAEERLPAVTCIGVWDSSSPLHAGSGMYSSVVTVWYQLQLGLSDDEDSRARFRTLDWERLAAEWSW